MPVIYQKLASLQRPRICPHPAAGTFGAVRILISTEAPAIPEAKHILHPCSCSLNSGAQQNSINPHLPPLIEGFPKLDGFQAIIPQRKTPTAIRHDGKFTSSQVLSPHPVVNNPHALEIAARPLGTSANFNPADGERYPGNLPVILR